MDSSKKAPLSKAVLNVTTYIKPTENELFEEPQAVAIDITDLLAENGVMDIADVRGVSFIEDYEGYEKGLFSPVTTRFMVDSAEIDAISADIFGIIDAAIVNEKQGKAIKNLVTARFNTFILNHHREIGTGPLL